MTDGFRGVGSDGDTGQIDEDNDGEFPNNTYRYIVDLPLLLSEQLGKQLSQMATYRVNYIQMDLRNVNDQLDNDNSIAIGGTVRWYTPTAHRVDALQYAREYKRESTGGAVASTDPWGYYTNDSDYKGLRFTWDADSQLDATATTDDTVILSGQYFSMQEMFDHYNRTINGTPEGEGRDTSGEGQALWNTRVGLDEYDTHYWVTSFVNAELKDGLVNDESISAPRSTPWSWASDQFHLPVLGGLMEIEAVHCSTDAPGLIEDEYYLQVTIGVTGWDEF